MCRSCNQLKIFFCCVLFIVTTFSTKLWYMVRKILCFFKIIFQKLFGHVRDDQISNWNCPHLDTESNMYCHKWNNEMQFRVHTWSQCPQYWIVSRAAHHSVCIFSFDSTLSRRNDSRRIAHRNGVRQVLRRDTNAMTTWKSCKELKTLSVKRSWLLLAGHEVPKWEPSSWLLSSH